MKLDPKGAETLAEEFGRLVREYQEPDTDGTQVEAWNLIADFAVGNADVIARALSTVAPDEVGGLVDARSSLWVPARPEHAKVGWTYDFEQTERISRAAYDSTGYDATMEVVEFVMTEADRRHATALEAQAAELAAVNAENRELLTQDDPAFTYAFKVRAERAEAALAEARRELDEAKRRLFPYADATEICGYSTTGIYLIGDRKSVDAAKKAFHYSAQIDEYRTAFNERVKATKAQRDEALKALEPFARNVELIHPGAQDHDRLCDYGSQFNGTPTVGQARVARRALTGGQEE